MKLKIKVISKIKQYYECLLEKGVKKDMMDFISLYCGADNLGDGITQAGGKLKLAIDIESDCCETVKLNNPNVEVICGKVSDYLESLPKTDAIVGGPPCPEFSRAKTNRTFDMCEINNFWQAVKLVKPKYYFMENVQDIKKKLYKGSYLINCADYGVPQTRKRRIFSNLSLPSPTHAEKPQENLFGHSLKNWVSVKEALNLTDSLYISIDGFARCNQIEKTRSINEPSQTITTSKIIQITNYKIYSLKHLQDKNPTMYKKHPPQVFDKPCSTINTKDRATANDYLTDGKIARKLTNEELAILQGFRKDFKFYGNKTSVRKQIGNALPSAVSKAFFQQIIQEVIV